MSHRASTLDPSCARARAATRTRQVVRPGAFLIHQLISSGAGTFNPPDDALARSILPVPERRMLPRSILPAFEPAPSQLTPLSMRPALAHSTRQLIRSLLPRSCCARVRALAHAGPPEPLSPPVASRVLISEAFIASGRSLLPLPCPGTCLSPPVSFRVFPRPPTAPSRRRWSNSEPYDSPGKHLQCHPTLHARCQLCALNLHHPPGHGYQVTQFSCMD